MTDSFWKRFLKMKFFNGFYGRNRAKTEAKQITPSLPGGITLRKFEQLESRSEVDCFKARNSKALLEFGMF